MSLDLHKHWKRLKSVITLVHLHYRRFDTMVVGIDRFCVISRLVRPNEWNTSHILAFYMLDHED
jgi:hypothetical protein